MLLLSIAHRGEATEFIRRKHNLPVDFYFSGLYRSENELLLLSGAGIHSTHKRIKKVCHYFGSKIQAVVNFGIAGSLDSRLETNQIYAIRNSYHETAPEWYKSIDSRSKYDCVTAVNDVLENTYAQVLARIAHITDRELWAIASVCAYFDLPFRAYKLISDIAGSHADQSTIIRNSHVYSKHLFDFYTKLKLTKSILLKT